MFVFRKNYFLLTIILLFIEICIAVFINDRFIRPYLGDFLVVILLYCFVRSFFNVPVNQTAIGVLIFAFVIEGLQYIQLVNILGLQDSKLAGVVLGNSFSWMDMLTYVLGIALVMAYEIVNNFFKVKNQIDQKAI